jgi:uncharacterized protein YqjF (DUF2071 family)
MRQRWHHLTFLHWPVETGSLQRLLPAPLQLDLYEGIAYVGLVLFTMTDVGLESLPPRFAFHETNVRTYVRGPEGDPGVWFFSLDAASAPAVLAARAAFHLPYYWAEMGLRTHRWHSFRGGHDEEATRLEYRSRRRWPHAPATLQVSATPQGAPQRAVAGTREHFLVERYRLFARRGRTLFSGDVRHAPYPLQSATAERVEETLLARAGILRPSSAPLAHYARGVDVRVEGLRRVGA